MWGVGSVQLYFYYKVEFLYCFSSTLLILSPQSHGHTDEVWMKAYVFVAWALDTVHEIILLKVAYVILVC